jgi:DNA-binding response OmpR family regulator
VREGPLQGYYVRHLTVAEWPALVADGEAPHIVVTPLSSLEDVRGIASAVNVPIIALEPDGDGRRVRGVHRPYDGVVVMAAGEDPGMLFEVADHAAQRSTPGGATLLVVDDDRDMLALVRAVMEPEGLRVVTLGDPARLLETIENTHPSLLLMDVSMDSFDGIALTRGLRDDPRWRELPIILFSSETDAERRRMAYAALADDFVPKPVVPEELRRRLRARLEQVRLRRLGEGLHPGTGLPLAARTAREAARTIELAGAAPIAIALVRPRGVLPRGAAADAWMHEAERLARLLGRADIGTVGLTNDDGLLVVTTADVGVLDVALRNAADDRLPNVPVWTAGLASSSDVRRSLDALQQAAEEALAAADGQPVHRWSPDDDALAPDVVVVEDDEALSDMLQYALRAAGFTFRAYTSGTAALEGLLRLRPGTKRVLVLLDVDLPGLDGHSLHERLRVERPDHFAVVFATAHASEAEQLRALHAGAIDYVMKPIALRVLMAKVRIWIARAEQRGS